MDRTAVRPSSAWYRLCRSWPNAISVGERTKTVSRAYTELTDALGSEFTVLLDSPIGRRLRGVACERIAEGIARMRAGDVAVEPGYDGHLRHGAHLAGWVTHEASHRITPSLAGVYAPRRVRACFPLEGCKGGSVRAVREPPLRTHNLSPRHGCHDVDGACYLLFAIHEGGAEAHALHAVVHERAAPDLVSHAGRRRGHRPLPLRHRTPRCPYKHRGAQDRSRPLSGWFNNSPRSQRERCLLRSSITLMPKLSRYSTAAPSPAIVGKFTEPHSSRWG